MVFSYLSNQYWLPGSTDGDCMLQQPLELPQELELDHLVCFQDDFTLADTSIDPLFFHTPQPQPTFIPQSQPQLPTTYRFHQLQQDFHQQQQCYYSNNKRQKITHYPNSNSQDETMLPCTNTDPLFDSQVVNHEAWLLPDVTFPPVFDCGSLGNNNQSSNSNYMCGGRVGGLSAQSIAARQRRRKIADKTQELVKLIPGGLKMNTAEMFHSASMYVKFLQAQTAVLILTNNSLQEGSTGCVEEQHHLKLLAESPIVQEKLYTHGMCLAPCKLLRSLSKDSKLQSDHPSLVQSLVQCITTRLTTVDAV